MTEQGFTVSSDTTCGREGQRWRRGQNGCGKGRHREHGGSEMRPGRMLAQGDLRLIVLVLLAEQPRHGYDIIKVVEDRSAGCYVPSAGVVYPTLTFLEEVGHIASQPEGTKKLYSITPEGRAHLAQHRPTADAILHRLAAIGAKSILHARNGELDSSVRPDGLTQLLRASIDHLRDLAAERVAADPDAEAELVATLARVAINLRKPSRPVTT